MKLAPTQILLLCKTIVVHYFVLQKLSSCINYHVVIIMAQIGLKT